MSHHFSIEILKANRKFYVNSFFSRFFSGFLAGGIRVRLLAFMLTRILIFKLSAKHRHLSHSESCSFIVISRLNVFSFSFSKCLHLLGAVALIEMKYLEKIKDYFVREWINTGCLTLSM